MTTPVVLPALEFKQSPNYGSREGKSVDLVVVHRWGASSVPVSEGEEKISYGGVISWFSNPSAQVSAHIVFPGSAVPGQATQMVKWGDMAWAEETYNPVSDEIESADDIWIGKDVAGMAVLARIVAFRLHVRDLPAVWSTEKGFCRHADLGAAGGGHTECPTTDTTLWEHFVSLVQAEAKRGGFRPSWGT